MVRNDHYHCSPNEANASKWFREGMEKGWCERVEAGGESRARIEIKNKGDRVRDGITSVSAMHSQP